MGDLLKLLGRGALTIIMLPFIAIYFLGLAIFALINHLINEVKTIIKYFKGLSINYKDDLQIKYEEICKLKELQTNQISTSNTVIEQALKDENNTYEDENI